jgi:hypothetical protein
MSTGTNNAAASEEAITTKGAILNIQEVVSEITWPLEKSLAKL